MKPIPYLIPIVLLSLLGCQQPRSTDTLYQVSLIDALLAAEYDGVATIGAVRKHGDFGLGTYDRLAGEMIVLDGVFYQAKVDGEVVVAVDEQTTPWASVTAFASDHAVPFHEPLTIQELEAGLDEAIGNMNVFYAMRIDTVLSSVTFRSVPEQSRPYEDLADVVRHQTVWVKNDVAGTLVGLRCPGYSKGINVPGYHWHFISNDRKLGGHVLEADLPACTVQVDRINDWLVELPDDEVFGQVDLDRDRSEELHKVETPGSKN